MSETYPKIVPNLTNIRPKISGTDSIGTLSYPFSGVYADNVFVDGIKLSNVSVSNVIHVSQYANGGFVNIAPAVASISGASAIHPYVVFVEPGVYSEPLINIPSYVYVVGRDEKSVIVQPVGNNSLFNLASTSAMAFLTIQNVPTGYYGATIIDSTDQVLLHKVSFYNCWTALRAEATPGNLNGNVYLEYVDATSSNANSNVFEFIAPSGSKLRGGGENFYVFSAGTNAPIGILASGQGVNLSFRTASSNGSDDTGIGFLALDGVKVIMSNFGLGHWATGLSIPQYGEPPFVKMYSTPFDENIINIDVAHSGATGFLSSYSPYDKKYVNPSSPFFFVNKDQRVITVNKKGGDFSSISDAVSACVNPSDTNAYIVYVGPGIYDEPLMSIPSYVSIVGQSQTSVVVQPTGNNSLFDLTSNATMSFLSIQNVPIGYYGVDITNPGNYITIHKVSFVDCNVGMRVFADDNSPDNQVYLEYVDSTQSNITDTAFQFVSVSGTPLAVNCENFYVYGGDDGTNPPLGILASGAGLNLSFRASALLGKDGTGKGIEIMDGANVKLPVLGVSNWATGVYVPQIGANPNLEIYSTAFGGNTSYNLDLQHSGLTGFSNTYSPYLLNNINPANQFFFVNKDQKIVVVAKKGGDFRTVSDALNAISGLTSATDIYTVQINPGIYDEPAMVIPPYTSIKGDNMEGVIVQPTGDYNLFTLSNRSDMQFLTLFGNGYSTTSSAVYGDNVGSYSTLHKVYIDDFNKGMTFTNSTSGIASYIYLEYASIQTQNVGQPDHAISVASNHGGTDSALTVDAQNFTIYSYDQNPTNAILAYGKDVTFLQKVSDIEGLNLSGNAINVHTDATFNSSALTVNNFNRGVYNENTGGPANLSLSALNVSSCNEDISIKQPNSVVAIVGSFDSTNSTIDSPNTTVLNSDASNTSSTVMGDLYLGKPYSDLQYMSPLISNNPTMGLVNGGELTSVSGLTIGINAGYGYVDTDVADWTKTKYISWISGTHNISPSSDVYIYVNSNGIFSDTNSSIVGDVDKVLLGRVITTSTAIDFIEHTPQTASHIGNAIEEVFRDAFGPIVANGMETSTSSGLTFSISAGEYYFGSTPLSIPLTIPTGSAFVQFFHVSGNQSSNVNFSGVVPNNQYDDLIVASGLTNLTPGYYTKHGLWLTAEIPYPLLVYGQTEYSGLSTCQLAPTPTPSTTFKDTVVHISDIIVQEGSGVITQITDTRPVVSFKQSLASSSSSNNHSTLFNLNANDHNQYLLRGGGNAMAADLAMGGNNITNVGLVGGITPSGHASRHLPNGADPITTAAPLTNLNLNDTNVEGSQNSLARSDQKHGFDIGVPVTISALTNSSGTSPNFIRADHLHAHGVQSDETLHALASASQAGFLSSGSFVSFTNKVNRSGDTMTGTLNVPVLSGTTISGNTIRLGGNDVIVSGTNLGTGISIFSSKSTNNLQFNSVSGVGTVTSSLVGNTIIFSGTQYSLPSNVIQSASNSGTGFNIFNSQDGSNLIFNTISGLGNVTLYSSNGLLSVSGTQYTLPSNVVQSVSSSGNGVSLYNTQVGSEVYLNSISGLGNITITSQSNGVVNISGASTESTTASSSGTGYSIYNSQIGSNLIFNTISGAGNVALSSANGLLTVSGTQYVLPSTVTFTTVNASVISGTTISGDTIRLSGNDVIVSGNSLGTGYSIFASKSNNNLQFNSISGAGTVSVTSSNNLITVSGQAASTFTSPTTTTDTAVTLWSGTTAGGFLNSSIIVSNTGQTLNAPVLSGTIISGNTINVSSAINLASGVNIANNVSGINNLGTATNPFNTLYTNEISGVNARGYVFAYDTTNQNLSVANNFQDVTFNNSPIKDGWSHTSGTATFTCNLAGTYQATYTATVNRTANPSVVFEIRNRLNGSEILGSQTVNTLSANNIPVTISNSIIFNAAAGNTFTTQIVGSATNAQIGSFGANATARPSMRLVISKL